MSCSSTCESGGIIMSLLMKRNSVRSFTDKPVPSEFVTKLLESGMQAPSANNQQP